MAVRDDVYRARFASEQERRRSERSSGRDAANAGRAAASAVRSGIREGMQEAASAGRYGPSRHTRTSRTSGYTQKQTARLEPRVRRGEPSMSFTREDNVRRRDNQEQVGRAIQRIYDRAKGGRGGGTR